MPGPEALSPTPVAEEIREAVRLFNERAFHESHDLFEDAWAAARGPRRTVLKALVKIAAGMYHLQTSGFPGAESLLSAGLETLRGLPDDVDPIVHPAVFDPVARCLAKIRLLRSGVTVEWEEQDLPRMELLRSGRPSR